jgi:hypothetical protein
MDTEGTLAPETTEAARAAYDSLTGTARTVVREVAKAMSFDAEEYDRRVTPAVVATAREALFAEMLAVEVGSREEFEQWRESFDGEVTVLGSDNVERVVWHEVAFAGAAVAATFHAEREAAVGTLRRQAFGRYYREVVCDE